MTYIYVMKRKISLKKLTKAEEEIMQIIWQLDKCLVRDIIERLGKDDIPHSTVSSVVRILEKKGFVDHKAYGKTHEYFPIISKEDYASASVKNVLDSYFSGSAGQLVSFLVKKENMDLAELNSLIKSLNNEK